jgi:hypothetical protein
MDEGLLHSSERLSRLELAHYPASGAHELISPASGLRDMCEAPLAGHTQRGDQRRCRQSRECVEQCTRCRVSLRLCAFVPVHQLKPRAPRRCCYGITVQKSWQRQHRTEEIARCPRGCRLARVLTGQPFSRPNCCRRQHARALAHCGSLRCIVAALCSVFRDCGLHVLHR